MISREQSAGREAGFTIIELIIATVVFSAILLGAMAGFLRIGHVFYKGVSTTNTQTVANQIMQDLNGEFQGANSFSASAADSDYSYFCIGGFRYTYNIKHELNTEEDFSYLPGGNFGLLKDNIHGCADPCGEANPADCSGSSVQFKNPTELLGDKMRLMDFKITPVASTPGLFNISLVLAYGDDDVFNNVNDAGAIACKDGGSIDQFCNITRLSSSVFEGTGR